MTREEAKAKLKVPLYEPKQLEIDRVFFRKKLKLSDDDWAEIMRTSPRRHEEFPNQLVWQRWRTRIKQALENRGIRVRRNW
jgi:hypothetical protein